MSNKLTQGVQKRGRTGLDGTLNLMISQNTYQIIQVWYKLSSKISLRYYLKTNKYFGIENFNWILAIQHFNILSTPTSNNLTPYMESNE
jgi:hypothetical protein